MLCIMISFQEIIIGLRPIMVAQRLCEARIPSKDKKGDNCLPIRDTSFGRPLRSVFIQVFLAGVTKQ